MGYVLNVDGYRLLYLIRKVKVGYVLCVVEVIRPIQRLVLVSRFQIK